LLQVEGQKVTVASFSVNPSEFAKIHEIGAAPTEERFRACKKLQDGGYEVRLRIDFPFGEKLSFDNGKEVEKLVKEVYTTYELKPSRWTLRVPRINNPKLWEIPFFAGLKKEMDWVEMGKWRYNREKSIQLYLK
jgi:DNA repair photolyase